MREKKLHKSYCEIDECSVTNTKLLHHHHIVERKEVGTCNNKWNLAVVCANCHNLIHSGELEIVGVYPSTNIEGRQLVYKRYGVCNIFGITEAYFKHHPAQMRLPSAQKEENEKKPS